MRHLQCALVAALVLTASLRLERALGAEAEKSASNSTEKSNDKPESKSKMSDSKDKKRAETKKVRLAHIQIDGTLPESPGEMSLFGDLGTDLRKTMARIEKAADDSSVSGVVLQIDAAMGRGKINELRSSIKRVQDEGKKVYAYLEAAEGPQYLLASACDEVVMPEAGMLLVPGVRLEGTFFKNLFDKVGLEADMMHVGAYKGAAEPYTRRGFSDPVKENLTKLVDDVYDDMLTTIATDRGLKVDEVRKAIDRGLLLAEDAKEAGLIDRLEYPDQFRARLADEYNTDKLVFVENYAKKKVDADFSGPMGMMKFFQTVFGGEAKSSDDSGVKLALIYAVGPIMTGESTADILGDATMGSTTIVEALRDADEDDSVKAIVMRVDSPGGSALASDLIWRKMQAIDKPIVVSMGNVAASGGYYISMGADKIFAEPATITGSIGVVGGKVAMKGLFDKIGVSTDAISCGEHSGMFSSTEKFSTSERELVERMMKDIYEQFTSKAAKGRDMDLDKLEKLAGGQVYTGRVAKRLGLIDEVGTLRDATAAAKRLAGLDPDQKVELKVLPKAENPLEQLLGAEMDQEKEVRLRFASELVAIAPQLKGALRHAAAVHRAMQDPAATIMPVWIEIK